MTDTPPPKRRTSDDNIPVLLHRMDALERGVKEGFADVKTQINELSFVRADVYSANNVALEQRLANIEADVAEAKRPGIWALSLLGAAFVTVLVGVLVRIALQAGGA